MTTTVTQVFETCFGKHPILTTKHAAISCIYLLALIDSDSKIIAYRYGRTNNLRKRLQQHRLGFGRKGYHIELIYFAAIVPDSLPPAEQRVRTSLNKLGIRKYVLDGSRELITLDASQLPKLIDTYDRISAKYGAAITGGLVPSPAKRFPSPKAISRLPTQEASMLLDQLRADYLLARQAEQRAKERYHACMDRLGNDDLNYLAMP